MQCLLEIWTYFVFDTFPRVRCFDSIYFSWKISYWKISSSKYIYILLNVCPNILFNIKIKGHSRLNKVLEIFSWQTKCIQSSSYCLTHAYKNRKAYLFSKNCSLGENRFMVIQPCFQIWYMNYVNVSVMFLWTVSKTLIIMSLKSDKFSSF